MLAVRVQMLDDSITMFQVQVNLMYSLQLIVFRSSLVLNPMHCFYFIVQLLIFILFYYTLLSYSSKKIVLLMTYCMKYFKHLGSDIKS